MGLRRAFLQRINKRYLKYLLLLGLKRNWESCNGSYVPGLLSIQDTFSIYQAAGEADTMLLLPRRHCACRPQLELNTARFSPAITVQFKPPNTLSLRI